jgi:hypothetical protein
MNKQQIFDKVARHLLKQNAKSRVVETGPDSDETVHCKYRGPDGLMCAVGCLIPDDLYDPKMEGRRAHAILGSLFFDRTGISREDMGLLEALQSIHDNTSVRDWPGHLRNLAESERIDDAVLDEVTS